LETIAIDMPIRARTIQDNQLIFALLIRDFQ
jgi:hypothetical protein